MQNKEIEVKTLLTKDEYVKANKVIRKIQKKESKRFTRPIGFILFAVMICVGIYNGLNMDEGNNEPYIPSESVASATTYPWYLPLLPILFIFLISIAYIFFLKKAPNKHYDSNKLIQNEIVYKFNVDGVECYSERSSSKVVWNEFYKAYISKEFVVLYVSNMTVWIIPKKSIEKENIDSIIDLLKSNLNKKKVIISNY